MKLGYFTMTHNPLELGKDRQDPKQVLEDTLAQCLYAEELGFNSAWVPEHHFGLLGVLPSPATFLSYVAAKTQRIKLAPATVVLPLNHPLRLAEEFALLDLLSDGRAIFSARNSMERSFGSATETRTSRGPPSATSVIPGLPLPVSFSMLAWSRRPPFMP